MRRRLTLSLLALLLLGCPTSHDLPTCDDGVCPAGLVCVHPPVVPASVCAEPCDTLLAHGGEARICLPYGGLQVCWPGGTRPEGGRTGDSRNSQRGVVGRPDYESEPFDYTCEPLCETDADCGGPGETCAEHLSCGVSCAGPTGIPCRDGSTCVDAYCVNARRFSLIDCDGDGDADCPLNGMCNVVPDPPCVPVADP